MRILKETIIERAANDMFDAMGLDCVLEFDRTTARMFMRRIWKKAFRKGRARGVIEGRIRGVFEERRRHS